MINYQNKRILAPMVRVGSLPLRLLALKYGADIVYSPELIAFKLAKCERVENTTLGTVDFFYRTNRIDDELVLRVDESERSRLVVQIGAPNPEIALAAATVVQNDVAAIDLNCGCPKKFSTQGEMGAALLELPDTLCNILSLLVKELSIPVSCKIRLLDPKDGKTSQERTIELLRRIEATGVAAVGVHCRFRDERPREPGHWDVFDDLAKSVKIPLIANGDIYTLNDMERLKNTTGSQVCSFMFARGAQANVSLFRKDGMLDIREVMQEYLRLAYSYEMPFVNSKYTLMQMNVQDRELFRGLQRAKSMKDFFELLDIASEFVEKSAYDPKLKKQKRPKPDSNNSII